MLPAQGDGRRDTHQAARLAHRVPRCAVTACNALKRRLHVGDQLLPGLGQPHRACGAAYQQHASCALQLADTHADRRFRRAQTAGGFGKAFRRGQHGQQMQVSHEGGELVG